MLRNDRRRGRQDPNSTHNAGMMNKKKTNKKKRQDHDHSAQNLSSETELSDRSCAPDSSPSTFLLLYLLLLRALREYKGKGKGEYAYLYYIKVDIWGSALGTNFGDACADHLLVGVAGPLADTSAYGVVRKSHLSQLADQFGDLDGETDITANAGGQPDSHAAGGTGTSGSGGPKGQTTQDSAADGSETPTASRTTSTPTHTSSTSTSSSSLPPSAAPIGKHPREGSHSENYVDKVGWQLCPSGGGASTSVSGIACRDRDAKVGGCRCAAAYNKRRAMARSEIASNAGRPYIGEPGGTWGSRDCHTNAASVVHKPGGIYSHGRIEVQAPSKAALLHGADRKVVVSAPSQPGPEHLVLRQSLLMSAARDVKADVAKATVDCQ